MEEIPVSGEVLLVGWSFLLLFAYIMVQAMLANRDVGLDYNAGNRHGDPDYSRSTIRARRALDNFLETYPAFIGLALGLAIADQTGGLGFAGALIWFVARIAYLPIYVLGIKWVRTGAWGFSLIGLLLMFIQLVF